jgi:hypothetical protein
MCTDEQIVHPIVSNYMKLWKQVKHVFASGFILHLDAVWPQFIKLVEYIDIVYELYPILKWNEQKSNN